ncbi:hypothetical protein [Serratia sp. UGAL515B_01]|uniref:hypothetical protein n=1 Tax=Serratia sp. UGAL515B_01 TaxID=2986763 RepID=UPI002954A6AB|nr:hypothetical protein [Serratia sp. UGAL515B_01]WON79031.1 hypothetical protein OK023_17815 [Serratia sp. UGAL515B_01]
MGFIALRADDINFCHEFYPKCGAYAVSKSASRPEKARRELGLIDLKDIDKLKEVKEIKKDFANILSLKINNIGKDTLSSVIGER